MRLVNQKVCHKDSKHCMTRFIIHIITAKPQTKVPDHYIGMSEEDKFMNCLPFFSFFFGGGGGGGNIVIDSCG